MLRIRDTIAGEPIQFACIENGHDLEEVALFVKAWKGKALAIDTESTGLNCYRPDWQLRTVQIGNAAISYVIPGRWFNFIGWIMRQKVNWIGHNGPHDIRSIDSFLGWATGVICAGETYIPAHHRDSRKKEEGGTGHGLKELAENFIDPEAGKWERELKRVFKTLTVPVPGEVYKSGPRKGQPKVRKARLEEGWSLIDPMHPAYIAYAAADPILTYRVWRYLQPIVREFHDLYRFDKRVQDACDKLQRRAIRLDVRYTKRLNAAYTAKAEKLIEQAGTYGCRNIHSGAQVAETLLGLGVRLTERTPTGKYTMTDRIMREVLGSSTNPDVVNFLRSVLGAKQLLKRRESYTESMLREMDSEGRVHPSINSLGARTARMSVSRPPLQQLPTKDREDDI
jgi:DNA polymerase I